MKTKKEVNFLSFACLDCGDFPYIVEETGKNGSVAYYARCDGCGFNTSIFKIVYDALKEAYIKPEKGGIC